MKTLLVSGNWTVVPFLKALSESYALVVLYDANMPAIQAQGVQNAVPLASFAQPGMADYAWDVAAHIVNGLDVDEMFGRLPVPPDNYLLGWAIRQWAQHVLWIEQLKQVLLQRGEIAGLVVHEDVTQYMKVAVQWCKAHGIQSMQVAHGNYGCETQAIGNGIHEVLNTDYVAAGNWRQGAFFEHICGDASRVRVTGFPQWDLWAKLVPDQEMARGLLHMPMDRPVIGYLTSWAEGARKDALTEQFAATFKALCDVVKKRNYGLVVKVHPAAEQNNMLPKSWYVEQAKQEGIHCTITHEYNDAVLQAIDLAFSCWPTCMMSEVLMMGLPGIYLGDPEPYGWPLRLPYQEDRGALAQSLEEAFAQVLSPEWQRANESDRLRYIYDTNYLADGRASERVVSWCRELWPC